jgi:hypothetical protein
VPVPEKDDMMLPEKTHPPFQHETPSFYGDHAAGALQCLFSGYLREEDRCQCRIPEPVVAAAWRRELEHGGAGEGFFRLTWREGQWLAYGHRDGDVRGVYCPEHAAGRDQRASAAVAGSRAPQLVA